VKTNVSGVTVQRLNGLEHGDHVGLQRDRALAVLRLRRVVLATVRETRTGQRARAEIGRRPTAGRPPAGAEPGVEERVDQRMARRILPTEVMQQGVSLSLGERVGLVGSQPAASDSRELSRPRRLTDFPSVGRDELRSPIRAKLRNTRRT